MKISIFRLTLDLLLSYRSRCKGSMAVTFRVLSCSRTRTPRLPAQSATALNIPSCPHREHHFARLPLHLRAAHRLPPAPVFLAPPHASYTSSGPRRLDLRRAVFASSPIRRVMLAPVCGRRATMPQGLGMGGGGRRAGSRASKGHKHLPNHHNHQVKVGGGISATFSTPPGRSL